MYKFIIHLALILPSATIAITCTDDYIISGGRKIDLLPDHPFYIQQMNSSISIQRGDFVLIFSNMQEVYEKNLQIQRYNLDLLMINTILILFFHVSIISKDGKNILQAQEKEDSVGFVAIDSQSQ